MCFFSLKGDKLKNPEERDSMIVDCLIKLGRLDEAAKKLNEMILASPDHWLYIKTYIRCQVQRCQNFRERVRQQVERDRRSRAAENGTSSDGGDSTNEEESRVGKREIEKEGERSEVVDGEGSGEKTDGVSSLDRQGEEEEEKGKEVGGDNERGRGEEGEEKGKEVGGDNERGRGEEGEGGESEETAAATKEITVRWGSTVCIVLLFHMYNKIAHIRLRIPFVHVYMYMYVCMYAL